MRALIENGSFLRLFGGSLVTNAGDSIYYIATMWLVYEMSNSTFYTGLASFLVLIPTLLQFLTGPIADRVSVKRLLIVTQGGQALLVLLIPLAAAVGRLSVELVLFVIPLASLVNQFTMPSQASALPRIVHDENLSDANSLFKFATEGTNMAFNAIAGAMITTIGVTGMYLVNGATFGLAILLFAGLTIPARQDASERSEANTTADLAIEKWTREYWQELLAGFNYVRGTAFVPILLPDLLVRFATGMMLAVLPAYAAMMGQPDLYGLLLAAMAVGGLVGSLVALRVKSRSYGRVFVVGASATCLLWAVVVFSSVVPIVLIGLTLAVVFPSVNDVLFQTLMQTVVPDDTIGRVVSLTSARMVATPVGSLIGGAIATIPRSMVPSEMLSLGTRLPLDLFGAETIGPVPVLLVMAVANLVGSVYFLAKPSLRSLPSVSAAEKRDPRIEDAG